MVVVVVVDVVVVSHDVSVVKASSGTITQPVLSMFQANITHVPPPFSYIHKSSGWSPALISRGPDSVAEQPWSPQLPHSFPSISIMPPSSDANQNSMVLCSGIVMKPVM